MKRTTSTDPSLWAMIIALLVVGVVVLWFVAFVVAFVLLVACGYAFFATIDFVRDKQYWIATQHAAAFVTIAAVFYLWVRIVL